MENKEAYFVLKEEFQTKFDNLDRVYRKEYLTLLLYLGSSGEYQSNLDYYFSSIFRNAQEYYKVSLTKALSDLTKAKLIEKVKDERKNVLRLTKAAYFPVVCVAFKEAFQFAEEGLKVILHNIYDKQPIYEQRYWGSELKVDSFIRAIFFSDKMKVEKGRMLEGFAASLNAQNQSRFLPLFNILLLEDEAQKCLTNFFNDKNFSITFFQYLIDQLQKEKFELGDVLTCLDYCGAQGYVKYADLLGQCLHKQLLGLPIPDVDKIQLLPPVFQNPFYAHNLLLEGANEQLLASYFHTAGVNIHKDFNKKSSKFWMPLDIANECFFLLMFVDKYAHERAFFQNRIDFLYKREEQFKGVNLLHACLNLAVYLKDNSDLNLSYSEKTLKDYVTTLWRTLTMGKLKSYPPILVALFLHLSMKVYPKLELRDTLIVDLATIFLTLVKNRLHLYAKCFVEQLEKKLDQSYSVYFERLKNTIPFSFNQLLKVDESEEWEKMLKKVEQLADAFEHIDGKEKTTFKGQSERFVWAIDSEQMTVRPYEQSRLKNGNWGKLKAISDKRLCEKNVKGALPIDLEIIKKAYKNPHSYYYHAAVDYYPLEVWKRLEGHPNVVLESNMDMPITVTTEQVELQVEENKNGYSISIGQNIDLDFPVKKETPTRYTYYNVDQKIRTWMVTFPQGVSFPKQSKDRLKAVVGQLSRSLEVHSKTEDIKEELPEISADTQIHALLTPKGNDVLLNLYMKPFGNIPPYVVPGKGKEDFVEEVNRVRTRAVRDFAVEKKKIREFFKERPSLQNTDEGSYTWLFTEREDLLNALVELELGGDKPVIEWPEGVKFKLLGAVDSGNLNIEVKSKKVDWFGVEGSLQVNEQVVVSLLQLLTQFKENPNLKYIEISDGQFIALTAKLRKQISAMSQLAMPTKDGLEIHKMASVGLMDSLRESSLKADAKWKEFEKQIDTANNKRFTLPKNLNAELRDYQTEGFKWLSRLDAWGGGACLADDMGLGKTLQGISLLLNKAKEGPSLVIAPSSVGFNWVKEIHKFAPSLKASLLVSETDREKLVKKAKKNDVIICSYGLLQTGAEYLTQKEWNIVILDEAQAIKNKGTKRSKEAMKLQARSKIAMTGTPIENNLAELWNLFQFINPGLLGSWEQFNQNFVLRIMSDEEDHAHAARQVLRNIIKPFLLRRNKNEVLDELPSKTEIVLDVEMSEQETTYYEALRRIALEEIEDIMSENDGNGTVQVLAQLTKLRQACCHISLLDHQMQIESSKVNLFLEIVEELKAGGHRALVFSQFVGFLEIVRAELDKQGITYQYLDGSTPMKKREKAVEDFQDGEGNVFLISLKAGGTGLNLTAADYVIHLDPWWNPAVEDQATDRAYRIGQERPVTVYRLITQNTIEQKMINLHHEKRQLADDLLSGNSTATKLNAKELLKLLAND